MIPGVKDEQGNSTVSYNVSISSEKKKTLVKFMGIVYNWTDERKLQCILGDRTK